MKRIHWALFAVIVVCLSPSTVWTQWPGQMNPRPGQPGLPPFNGGIGVDGPMNLPPGMGLPPHAAPNFRDQEKRRDEQYPWLNPHILGHLVPHGGHAPGAPNAAGPRADLHTPKVVPPEARVLAPELRFVPASEGTCSAAMKNRG
jgi:hypothetical protein